MTEARYDAVADFYGAGWSDSYDDSVSVALLGLADPLAGMDVLDLACGHGRISRVGDASGADWWWPNPVPASQAPQGPAARQASTRAAMPEWRVRSGCSPHQLLLRGGASPVCT